MKWDMVWRWLSVEFNSMKKVLITGAAGFIGRHVGYEFTKSGWYTLGIDRLQENNEFCEKGLFNNFIVCDLSINNFNDIVRVHTPDMIIQCAGSASVPFSITNPKEDFISSVVILFNVLEAIRSCAKNCKLVFLSSAAVYGNAQYIPIDEDHPVNPISPYGYHKSLCEKVLHEFHSVYGLRTCSVRIFSAYGAGLQRQILWDICQKAFYEDQIQLFGTGQETRDFIHVRDIARAIKAVAQTTDFNSEVYNIASGEDISIKDLATKLVNTLNIDCPICFTGKTRKGDPIKWRADISRLSSLGYYSTVSIVDGLKDYTRYFLEVINNNKMKN